MIVCKRVLYWGRVQGVSFRFTTRDLASQYVVAGHVRNLASGEVEVLVEGTVDQVEAFLTAVEQHMRGYIKGRTVMDEPPQGNKDFDIRY